jgi:glutaredoxin/glutathione-dependent peroxiredoxin
MPGAFTPTCTEKHLPGYVEQASQFKQLGYDTIAVLTTNDRFVNDQWVQSLGAAGSELLILSDGDGDLVRMLGLSEDMGFGVGIRAKRFALVLEDGTVTDALTDEGLDECSATSAQSVLKMLKQKAGLSTGDDEGNVDISQVGVILAVIALIGLASSLGGDTVANL